MSAKRKREQSNQEVRSNGTKKRRSYSEHDSTLAKIFEDLAADDEKTRLDAAVRLISQTTPDNTEKILVRLVRGLCSSRKSARLGFFTALTEILARTSKHKSSESGNVTEEIHNHIDLIKIQTKFDAAATGQEKRDHLLGRAAAYSALLHSKIAFPQISKTTEPLKLIASELCQLAHGTTWLREQSMLPLCETVKMLASLDATAEDYALQIVTSTCDQKMAMTPEGTAIWLQVRGSFPNLSLPKHVWHKRDPLSRKGLITLAGVMKGSSSDQSQNKTGARQIVPSFAWAEILNNAALRAVSGSADSENDADFHMVWTELVDNILFAKTASSERKAIGLQVFTNFMSTAPSVVIGPAFSPNLVTCLINQSSEPSRYLHQAAKVALNAVISRVRREPSMASTMFNGLIAEGRSIQFDRLTSTKTIQNIMALADEAAFSKILDTCQRFTWRPDTSDVKQAELRRQSIADQLLSAARAQIADQNREDAQVLTILNAVMRFFATVGYLVPQEELLGDRLPTPEVTENTKDAFKLKTSSLLASLMTRPSEFVAQANGYALEIISHGDQNGWTPSLQADKQVKHNISRASKVLKLLKRDSRTESGLQALELLLTTTLVQAYGGDPDAVPILEELTDCYESLKDGRNDAVAIEVIMEIILGLVSKPSALHRRLSQEVFTSFAEHITRDGLQSLLSVLEQKESAAGQDALFEREDDEDEGEESEGDESVEMIDAHEQNGISYNDESTSEAEDSLSSDGDEEDAEEEDTEELARFDKLLADTLKTSKPGDDATSDGDESSEDMDDDQMMALEPALTRIMQERKAAANKKNERKEARQNVINFKNRVLDLLSIYVKQQYSNPLALEILFPLLIFMRTTTTKQLSEKAFNLAKLYFDTCKHRGMPKDVGIDGVWKLFHDIQSEAANHASKLHASCASKSCLFLARLIVANDGANLAKVGAIYNASLVSRDSKKRLPRVFYNDWVEWAYNVGQAQQQ